MQARKIENTIKGYPEYEQICQRECNGECQEILSFATFVHTSKGRTSLGTSSSQMSVPHATPYA